MQKPKGRKTIAKDGEKMRNRNFRATDAEWEKCLKLGGGSFLRAKIRVAKVGPNGEVRGASVTAQPACEASSREAATSTVVLAGTPGGED